VYFLLARCTEARKLTAAREVGMQLAKKIRAAHSHFASKLSDQDIVPNNPPNLEPASPTEHSITPTFRHLLMTSAVN
jgi:hypothetical protein